MSDFRSLIASALHLCRPCRGPFSVISHRPESTKITSIDGLLFLSNPAIHDRREPWPWDLDHNTRSQVDSVWNLSPILFFSVAVFEPTLQVRESNAVLYPTPPFAASAPRIFGTYLLPWACSRLAVEWAAAWI
jgi:hypothetical protein